MLLKNPLIYAVSYIIKPTVESTRLCVTMLIFTKVVKSSQSRSKSELNNIKNKCKEGGLVEVDFGLRHFVVFLPAGIVFSVDADGEEGEIGESFVELAAEDVGGECVENPVALIVAGKKPVSTATGSLLKADCKASCTCSMSVEVSVSGMPVASP